MKKVLGLTALFATLILLFAGLAAATQIVPTATVREQFQVQPRAGVLKSPFGLLHLLGSPLQPTYCSPCLFYGGDYDGSGPNPNGLYNGNTIASATVYVPFTIPSKPKGDWSVTGMFANIQYYPSTAVTGAGYGPFAVDVLWSISTGLVAGSPPPTPICSGTDTYTDAGASELTFTGRIAFGLYGEYTTPVTIAAGSCPALEEAKKKGGPYWLSVVPECNSTDACPLPIGEELTYLSDAEDGGATGLAPEAYGPAEPWDASFFFSPGFGFPNLVPLGGTNTTVCGGTSGCDRFSSGVEGTIVK